MKLSFVIIIVLLATVVTAKKWSDRQSDGHKTHKGKHYDRDERDHRQKEKEQYYRKKHFESFDHKDIVKHSPIHITEDDAKLQMDIDEKAPKSHHRQTPDLHLQDLNRDRKHHHERKQEKSRVNHEFDANGEKMRDSNDKMDKHTHKKHESKKHHESDKRIKYSDDVHESDGFKERVIGEKARDGGKKHVKKDKRPKNKHSDKGKNRDKKQKYAYKKKRDGKKYKMTVYGKY